MLKSAVKRWDAVDVKMDNGEKRFGYVVDIGDDDLIVDFGDGHPVPVPSRRIRQPRDKPARRLILPDMSDQWLWEYYLRSGLATEDDHPGNVRKNDPHCWEAVLQLTLHAPYVWYPARVLATDEESFAVVEVLISKSRKEEYVLPYDHVRRPYSFKNYLACRPVWTAFKKQQTPVPVSFVSNYRVQELWNKERPCSKIIKVEDGILYYLMEDKPKNERKLQGRPLSELIANILVESRNEPTDNADLDQKSFSLVCGIDINTVIPRELLVKIFKFLTTENQARARQVCQRWNMLLHLPQFIKDVHIEMPKSSEKYYHVNADDPFKDSVRKIAACLYKALVNDAQKIVLTGSGMWTVLRALGSLMKIRNTGPIETLVLSNVKEWFNSFSDGDDNREIEHNYAIRIKFFFTRSLKKMFKWLVMENVTVLEVNCNFAFRWLRCDWEYPMADDMLFVHGVIGRLDLRSPTCACDWWDILEKYCPHIDLHSSIIPQGVQYWKSWKDEPHPYFEPYDNVPPETDVWIHVSQMLYGFERCDPRASDSSGGWAEIGDWDLSSLNRITIAVLDKFLRENYHPETGRFAMNDSVSSHAPSGTLS